MIPYDCIVYNYLLQIQTDNSQSDGQWFSELLLIFRYYRRVVDTHENIESHRAHPWLVMMKMFKELSKKIMISKWVEILLRHYYILLEIKSFILSFLTFNNLISGANPKYFNWRLWSDYIDFGFVKIITQLISLYNSESYVMIFL